MVFRDAGAPLTAGEGCQAGVAGEVVCRNALGDFANSVDVYAKDGDDIVDASAMTLRGFTVFVDGGSGSDVLTGSRARVNALFGDFVSSEVGDDLVSGGRADDFLAGRSRRRHPGRWPAAATRPPTATSATACGSIWQPRSAVSAAGERDTLRSIERLEGGDGADILPRHHRAKRDPGARVATT